MSEYISREWLLDYFDEDIDYYGRYVREDLLDNMPSIDIVRCKECKYWNFEMSGCKRNPSVVAWRDNDFCSYGERQTERSE